MTRRLTELARRYDAVAEAYRRIWGPVLAVLSAPVIDAISAPGSSGSDGPGPPGSWSGRTVLDVACGAGPLPRRFAEAGARTICLDLAHGALRTQTGARIAGSMTRIPLRDAVVDLAVNTFALQHTPTPGVVLREIARVSRPGGRVIAATWGDLESENHGAYTIVQRGLDAAGAPTPATPTGWHERVDSPESVRRHASRAGLHVERAWSQQVAYQWTPAEFLDWFSVGSHFGRRFQAMAPGPRDALIASLAHELASCSVEDLRWEPEVVFLLAEVPAG